MTAVSRPVRIAVAEDTPSAAEWCFVYVVLLSTAVIPGLSDKYNVPSQTVIQIFWSIAYAIAGFQLLVTRTKVLPLVQRYAAFWDLVNTRGFWCIAYVIGFCQLLLMETGALLFLRRYGALFTLIILMIVSTIWSVNPSTTFLDSVELLGTTLIAFYIAARFTLPEFLRILALVFATIGVISITLVIVNPGYGRAYWGAGPWQGIYQDKNILGAAASLAIISQLILYSVIKGRGRWLLVAGLLLAGLLLVKSNSATAFADCAIVLAVTFVPLACWSRRFGVFARFATVLSVAIVIFSIFAFGLTTDTVYSALGRSSDLTSRTDFWPYLQQAIGDRPVLGYGYDGFFTSPFEEQYLQGFIVQAGGWTPYHAHNSFLQALLNAGYLGLSALILVLLVGLWNAIVYAVREGTSMGIFPIAIILFLTIGSYTETYYLNYNSLEWILLVAALMYPHQNREKSRSDEKADNVARPAATVAHWKRSDRL